MICEAETTAKAHHLLQTPLTLALTRAVVVCCGPQRHQAPLVDSHHRGCVRQETDKGDRCAVAPVHRLRVGSWVFWLGLLVG